MSHFLRTLLPLLLIVSSCSHLDPRCEARMAALLKNQDFFSLRDALPDVRGRLPEERYLYYKALCDNAFFRCQESAESVDLLLTKYANRFPDTTKVQLLEVKAKNFIREYRYSAATEVFQTIVSQYAEALDSATIDDFQNSIRLYGALADTKPQLIHKQSDVTIPSFQNEFSHLMVPVSCRGSEDSFIFDTGANLSTITLSTASAMGLDIIQADVQVGSSTGADVQTQLAVADSIEVGGILFQNVVFLVLPDEQLSFPSIGYFIHGIIGLPVISQMEEISMNSDGTIFTPLHPADKGLQNMYLDGQTPVVQLLHDTDTLRLFLDTGANISKLFRSYFEAHIEEVSGKGTMKKIQRGGAGGMVDEMTYTLPHFAYTVGTRSGELDQITVGLADHDTQYDGVLGQDIFGQADRMILNFKYMYIDLE